MFVVKDGDGCVNAGSLLTMASSTVIKNEMATNHFKRNFGNLLATNTSEIQTVRANGNNLTQN